MATAAYIQGRKRYTRPQAIIWSENPGTLDASGIYIPTGQEIGANPLLTSGGTNQFLILSDHNRSAIQFKPERIEQRQRMINGNMRSHHIADKMTINFSWNNLPSRAFSSVADFDSTGKSELTGQNEYTADGGAGGVELLEWYEDHPGPFYVYLSYDKYTNFSSSPFNHLNQYNQILQVYFSSFDYSIVKRGSTTHDLWNISLSLEEV